MSNLEAFDCPRATLPIRSNTHLQAKEKKTTKFYILWMTFRNLDIVKVKMF